MKWRALNWVYIAGALLVVPWAVGKDGSESEENDDQNLNTHLHKNSEYSGNYCVKVSNKEAVQNFLQLDGIPEHPGNYYYYVANKEEFERMKNEIKSVVENALGQLSDKLHMLVSTLRNPPTQELESNSEAEIQEQKIKKIIGNKIKEHYWILAGLKRYDSRKFRQFLKVVYETHADMCNNISRGHIKQSFSYAGFPNHKPEKPKYTIKDVRIEDPELWYPEVYNFANAVTYIKGGKFRTQLKLIIKDALWTVEKQQIEETHKDKNVVTKKFKLLTVRISTPHFLSGKGKPLELKQFEEAFINTFADEWKTQSKRFLLTAQDTEAKLLQEAKVFKELVDTRIAEIAQRPSWWNNMFSRWKFGGKSSDNTGLKENLSQKGWFPNIRLNSENKPWKQYIYDLFNGKNSRSVVPLQFNKGVNGGNDLEKDNSVAIHPPTPTSSTKTTITTIPSSSGSLNSNNKDDEEIITRETPSSSLLEDENNAP